MKFAIFIPGLIGGGVERAMIRLAQAMTALGHVVYIVTFSTKGRMAGEVPAGVRLVDLGARSIAGSVLPFARFVWREKPDIVLSALPGANLVASLTNGTLCRRRPIIASQRGADQHLEGRPRRWRHRVLRTGCHVALQRADAIVCISEGVLRHLLATVAGLDPAKIHVIYNAVWSPQLEEFAKTDADHEWLEPGQDIPVFLGVGRLAKEKGFDTLIRAFAHLARRRRARLLILGEGEERQELERLADEMGVADAVSLPGFTSRPFAAMARCAALVLPSRHEGFGNVLVEAMACGASIVSTDCLGGPREVLGDGAFGRLVPVDDPEAMAQAMAAVIDQPFERARQVERARQFSFDAAAQSHLALATSLLRERTGRRA